MRHIPTPGWLGTEEAAVALAALLCQSWLPPKGVTQARPARWSFILALQPFHVTGRVFPEGAGATGG